MRPFTQETQSRERDLRERAARRYAPFLVWAFAALTGWLTLMLLLPGLPSLAAEHWRTALAMLVGSYVAGSTPMGGGTVGFPVLVLVFGESASLGRQFSFAIQSAGMTSAAIFILCSRRPLATNLMLWAMLASAITLPVASALLTPRVPEPTVKLAFACIWGAFGFLTLVKLREMRHWHHVPRPHNRKDMIAGVVVGVLGGVATALTGVGIDMIAYTVLVLLYRCDLRIAISTSVVLMAFSSLVATLTTAAAGDFSPDLLGHWVAAAPVVIFGAPLGALCVALIPRTPTMLFVAVLCLIQLVWMTAHVGVGPIGLAAVAVTMLAANAAFHMLYVAGRGAETPHRPA
jgi:uncharacterized membrane protein YfcA